MGGGSSWTATSQMLVAMERQRRMEQKMAEEEAKAARLEKHNKEARIRRNESKKNIIAEDGDDQSAVKRKALLGG